MVNFRRAAEAAAATRAAADALQQAALASDVRAYNEALARLVKACGMAADADEPTAAQLQDWHDEMMAIAPENPR